MFAAARSRAVVLGFLLPVLSPSLWALSPQNTDVVTSTYVSESATLDGGEGFNTPAGHAATTAATKPAAQQAPKTSSSKVGIGVKVGIMGIGIEAAVPVARKLNVRGGANFFNYSDKFDSDGINYDANLHFRSVEAGLDYFPWAKGFHLSPGVILYNGNKVGANMVLSSSKSFTLNDVDYYSSTTDPIHGTAKVEFNKAAPKFTVGWGNMVPRSGRHFSVPFEIGFAYVGDAKIDLNFQGHTCNAQGLNCVDVTNYQEFQDNVQAQQKKYQSDVADYTRLFPIVSVGMAFNF